MILFLATFKATVGLLLDVLMIMMFLRAIFSWFPGLSDSAFGEFLFTVTEWVITPVRALFELLHIDNAMVIDMPFFVTFIILSVVSNIL